MPLLDQEIFFTSTMNFPKFVHESMPRIRPISALNEKTQLQTEHTWIEQFIPLRTPWEYITEEKFILLSAFPSTKI